mmetsp:Transcript_24612/g.47977  ORF Transcript_24612/g.47977 Transcript_24612/m.47977 type:complete len:154 (+) Transcript_24612:86-547(+)|eukprot:CAMPEP_0172715234 /NCGR_PEP_ID=MMETSP1074-20121228/67433_1 /TAXON_ID=2916 /ORGANISM="Ceratium fusus, Strain PA161109" /LENGTH=153 /DNA_ID=CAMNT_0013539799 /DNA_START=27 /DNA_END=488 /DNA_ORIENTATION=-
MKALVFSLLLRCTGATTTTFCENCKDSEIGLRTVVQSIGPGDFQGSAVAASSAVQLENAVAGAERGGSAATTTFCENCRRSILGDNIQAAWEASPAPLHLLRGVLTSGLAVGAAAAALLAALAALASAALKHRAKCLHHRYAELEAAATNVGV